MEQLTNIVNSASGILSFIQNIPNMLVQCISNFPPALTTLLIAGLVVVIAIRFIELFL